MPLRENRFADLAELERNDRPDMLQAARGLPGSLADGESVEGYAECAARVFLEAPGRHAPSGVAQWAKSCAMPG